MNLLFLPLSGHMTCTSDFIMDAISGDSVKSLPDLTSRESAMEIVGREIIYA